MVIFNVECGKSSNQDFLHCSRNAFDDQDLLVMGIRSLKDSDIGRCTKSKQCITESKITYMKLDHQCFQRRDSE